MLLVTLAVLFIRSIHTNQCFCDGNVVPSSELSSLITSRDLELDYEEINVKLFTSSGLFRQETFCDPHGYFVFPVFESGEFLIKVFKRGTDFHPAEQEISIDTNKCPTLETTFEITGFSVRGKVVDLNKSGHQNPNGPDNIPLKLTSISEQGNNIVQETVTQNNGEYEFSSVLPGDYKVTTDHTEIKFSVDVDLVNVMENVVISGYKITGSVDDMEDPIDIKLSEPGSTTAIVMSRVDENGKYIFTDIPTGVYDLVPVYEMSKFVVEPNLQKVNIVHGDVESPESFRVVSFYVDGNILNPLNGLGIANVKVFVDDVEKGVTDENGEFLVNAMKPGEYTVSFGDENFAFKDELDVVVESSSVQLGEIYASGYRFCGVVDASDVQKIVFRCGKRKIHTFSSDGKFCKSFNIDDCKEFSVIVEDKITADESLDYVEQKYKLIDVINGVSEMKLEKVLLEINGEIGFMGENELPVDVKLTKLGGPESEIVKKVSVMNGNEFVFTDVSPGDYQLSINSNYHCFESNIIDLELAKHATRNHKGSYFKQTGFLYHFHSSVENMEIEIGVGGGGRNKQIPLGESSTCISSGSEVVKFTQKSCFKFEKEVIEFIPGSADNKFVLGEPTKYRIENQILLRDNESLDEVNVVVYENDGDGVEVTLRSNGEFEHYASFGDDVEIKIDSEIYLIEPQSVSMKIGRKNKCVVLKNTFVLEKGVRVDGSVVDKYGKPFENCVVVLMSGGGDVGLVMDTQTDELGKFSFGPLPKDGVYSVTPRMDGYYFSEIDDDDDEATTTRFQSGKLSSMRLEFVDQDSGEPLSEVFVSVTSKKKNLFRRNIVTVEDGLVDFPNLIPDTYFLKVILKEYVFEKYEKKLDLNDEKSVNSIIRGKRVLYSCYGKILSLNGLPIVNKEVSVIESDGDNSIIDTTTTNQEGDYRIRGLSKNKKYMVQIKDDSNLFVRNEAVVEMKEGDIFNINFVDNSVKKGSEGRSFFGRIYVDKYAQYEEETALRQTERAKTGSEVSRVYLELLENGETVSKTSIKKEDFFQIKVKGGKRAENPKYVLKVEYKKKKGEFEIFENSFSTFVLNGDGNGGAGNGGQRNGSIVKPILGTLLMFVVGFLFWVFFLNQ